ncbi:DeoR/GlpR transcriptional regulator [Enterococcus faecium]|nr:DeoR/GlpR transcriptional regulator [Enterococcus faecium]
MNQKKRLQSILMQLETNKTLSLKEVMALTGVSRDTARRDIVKLVDKGVAQRTYGGIASIESFKQLDNYLKRGSEQSKEKRQLALAASKMIEEHQTVYLDVSTTISFVPQFLTDIEKAFLVTNSIDIADQLLRSTNSKIRMLGGNLDKEKRCIVGTHPLKEIEQYKFDFSFIGAVGINNDGVYYGYEEDLDFKTKLREKSTNLVLLVDSSKINRAHNFKVFDYEDIDILITTKQLPNNLLNPIKKAGVIIIYTGEDKND